MCVSYKYEIHIHRILINNQSSLVWLISVLHYHILSWLFVSFVQLYWASNVIDWPKICYMIRWENFSERTSISFFSSARRLRELSHSDNIRSRWRSSKRFWWLSNFIWRRLINTSIFFKIVLTLVSFDGFERFLQEKKQMMISSMKWTRIVYFLQAVFNCERSSSNSLSDMIANNHFSGFFLLFEEFNRSIDIYLAEQNKTQSINQYTEFWWPLSDLSSAPSIEVSSLDSIQCNIRDRDRFEIYQKLILM